jgi:hypothetical protein
MYCTSLLSRSKQPKNKLEFAFTFPHIQKETEGFRERKYIAKFTELEYVRKNEPCSFSPVVETFLCEIHRSSWRIAALIIISQNIFES